MGKEGGCTEHAVTGTKCSGPRNSKNACGSQVSADVLAQAQSLSGTEGPVLMSVMIMVEDACEREFGSWRIVGFQFEERRCMR